MHIRVAVIVKIEDLSSTLINIGITIAKKNKQISGYIKRFPTTNLFRDATGLNSIFKFTIVLSIRSHQLDLIKPTK